MNGSPLSGSFLCGNFPTPDSCKGRRGTECGCAFILSPLFLLNPSSSQSINVCNHILELLCDFKVHLFHAAQTLIIPAVISKIIKYWLTHHSTLGRVVILPEDLEQFLKADVLWLVHNPDDFCMASFSLKETEWMNKIYWQYQFITSYSFSENQHRKVKPSIPSKGGKAWLGLSSWAYARSLWWVLFVKAQLPSSELPGRMDDFFIVHLCIFK